MKAADFRALSMAIARGRVGVGPQKIDPLDIICVLDEDLPAAQNSKKPTSAKATRLWWDPEREQYMEPSDYLAEGEEVSDDEKEANQEEVWNFSEAKSYDKDTFGFGDWKEPHFWFSGDCNPMEDREAPAEDEDE